MDHQFVGCAVDVNGQLKDAEDIQFYESESATTPIKKKAAPDLHSVRPAETLAGSRRTRTSRPTWKQAGKDPLDTITRTHHRAGAVAKSNQKRTSKKTAEVDSLNMVESSDSDSESEDTVQYRDVDISSGSASDSVSDEEIVHDKPKKKRKTRKTRKMDHRRNKGEKSTSERAICSETSGDEAAQYEREREKGDNLEKPHRHRSTRGNDERTRDIRTIFKPAERERRNGIVEKGHWCLICRTQHVSLEDSWFTGGVSTLRKHISRKWKTHGSTYTEGCEKLGIAPHERALPADSSSNTPNHRGHSQSTLDSFVQPTWTKDGLLDHIIELLVTADLPLQLVERHAFRRILKFMRPATKDSDIPHRTKIMEALRERAAVVQDRLREEMQDIPGQISVTFDSWTSASMDPYLAVTAHYIGVSPSASLQSEWTLKSRVLGFAPIEGNHGSANTAAVILRVVDRYNIRAKLGWITSDNVRTNDKCMRIIQRCLKNPNWSAPERRTRCIEHILHLCARDVINTVCPAPARFKKASRHSNEEECDEYSEGDESDDFSELTNHQSEDLEDSHVDSEPVDFEPNDVLGKLLALINQIRASPQARAYFETACREEDLKPLQLLKWVRTRWGSMYDLLDRAIALRKGINRFCRNADDSLKVPKLKNKEYSDYRITAQEWDLLIVLKDVLEEPRKAQASFSAERAPTVWRVFMALECMRNKWTAMANLPRFSLVLSGLNAGLEKLRKWYQAIEATDAYFICIVLNPAVKALYTAKKWDAERHEKGIRALKARFNEYAAVHTQKSMLPESEFGPIAKAAKTSSKTPADAQPDVGYSDTWLQEALADVVQDRPLGFDPNRELQRYLEAPLERNLRPENVVEWWGQHCGEYPILSRMALDYLPIQGSSVASERAFSSSGRTGTKLRNKIKPENFEAIQILKDGYRTGLITAVQQASLHADLLGPELTDLEDVTSDDCI